MEEYVKKGASHAETRNLREILAMRVLSASGKDLGRVQQVRLGTDGGFAGIVLRNLRGKFYISAEFIVELEESAIMLRINPSFMYKGLPVITADGKRVGKVIDVQRKSTTNDITGLVVRKLFKKITLPMSEVQSMTAAVQLNKKYADAKSLLS